MNTIFSKLNKQDVLSVILLFVMFFSMVYSSYSEWGNPVIDCFRNAYIPAEILNNKLLYKDIYYLYGPAVVYFHAFIFSIFGIKLNVLYAISIFLNSLIIISGYILARELLKPLEAFLCITIFVIQNIFFPSLVQYMFPFAYESVYGALIIILLLICYLKTIKSEFKTYKYFLTAGILTGIMSLVKQDMALSTYLIFYIFSGYSLYKNRLKIKTILISLIPVLIPAIIYSLILLYIPYSDLINGLIPLRFCFDIRGNIDFSNAVGSFLIPAIFLTIVTAIYYIPISISNKLNHFKRFKTTFISLLLLIILLLIFKDTFNYVIYLLFQGKLYQWLIIFYTIYLILLLLKYNKNNVSMKYTEKGIILLIICCLLLSLRNKLFLELLFSSNFIFLPYLIVLIYIIYNEIPALLSKLNVKYYTSAISSTLITFILILSGLYISIYSYPRVKIETDRGLYLATSAQGEALSQTINYIINSTKKSDYILAIPDESILYFMTGRTSPIKYYQFIPGMIENIKEETRCLNKLKENKPSLIIISNSYINKYYNKKEWGIDYDKLIYKWILKNYKQTKTFGNTTDSNENYALKIYEPI
ncbi:MAG: hypothetical protein AB7V50_11595 [Vampirovibrionia bacterium]